MEARIPLNSTRGMDVLKRTFRLYALAVGVCTVVYASGRFYCIRGRKFSCTNQMEIQLCNGWHGKNKFYKSGSILHYWDITFSMIAAIDLIIPSSQATYITLHNLDPWHPVMPPVIDTGILPTYFKGLNPSSGILDMPSIESYSLPRV